MGYPALLGIFIVISVSSLCLFATMPLSLHSISPKPNLTLNMTAYWPAYPPLSLSLTPPSLFPDKKFPVKAHFWLDNFFII